MLNQTGWDRLSIESNPAYADDLQAYAAGFAEGVLSAQQIGTRYWRGYPMPSNCPHQMPGTPTS